MSRVKYRYHCIITTIRYSHINHDRIWWFLAGVFGIPAPSAFYAPDDYDQETGKITRRRCLLYALTCWKISWNIGFFMFLPRRHAIEFKLSRKLFNCSLLIFTIWHVRKYKSVNKICPPLLDEKSIKSLINPAIT